MKRKKTRKTRQKKAERLGGAGLTYQPNAKHKEPWQRGKRGSLCPPEIDAKLAHRLLRESALVGKRRLAVYNGRAYEARCHQEPDHWHGYPIGWVEVPPSIRLEWQRARKVSKDEIRRYWGN